MERKALLPGRSEHQRSPGTNSTLSTFLPKPQVNSSTLGAGRNRISQHLARNSHFSKKEGNAESFALVAAGYTRAFDASGTSILDVSGNGIVGTLTGAGTSPRAHVMSL